MFQLRDWWRDRARFKPLEQDAGAGAHGGSAAAAVDAKQVENGWEHRAVMAGEVGEALESGGFDDGAGVFKKGVIGSSGAMTLGHCELEAATGEGKVPAEFLELGFGKEAEESFFGIGEDAGEGCGGSA
jgi:hypothetical protein